MEVREDPGFHSEWPREGAKRGTAGDDSLPGLTGLGSGWLEEEGGEGRRPGEMGRDGRSPGLTLAAVGELDSEPGVQAADGTSLGEGRAGPRFGAGATGA